ncbi:probable cyclin-dependent serine/threonine-protein kinase DDB_G0278487 [Anabrus simplex]|uniref:probable cyclin-dependent serine/threonine-protein kinase DDB_G0278487 n=1 Tax=Anabrus simplex TaxID=316456 RepID=UPI0035A2CC28
MNRPASGRSLEKESPSRESNTAGTQTEDAEDEFHQEVASPFHENESAKSQFSDDMPGINAQYSSGSYHELGNNSIPVSPLRLTVPDDPLQSPKFQSLSPRERKLADLRGSENYSPSFFGIPNHQGGHIDSGTLHFYQADDQQLKTRMRHLAYQEELRQQIEEKKRLEALQREKERKEEEAIMRRVREQQEKMRLEYEQEKAQRQIRQAQRLHMAEEFQRRQEELQSEAQQLREEEMKRRRGGGDGQVQEPVQKEFNEETILKQNMNDHQAKELEENQSVSFSYLSHSHPVPALRTKLLSEVNSDYQSPKEITQILDNNFPKALNYPHTNHTSIKSAHYVSQQLPKPNVTKEHHKRHTKRHKHRSAHLDLPIDSNAPNQRKIAPELQNQNFPDELPTSISHNKSHPEPASKEQHHNQKMPLSPHVEVLNYNEQYTEMPLIPRSHRRSGDIISEARPSNILTQLGDFRRQMQINHRKMQGDLQKKFPEKSSSF